MCWHLLFQNGYSVKARYFEYRRKSVKRYEWCYEWGPFIKVNEPLKHYFIYLFYFLHYLGPFFVFFVCLLQFLSLKIHKTYELNWWQNRWFSHRGRIQLPLDVSQALTTVLQGGSDPSYSQTRLYLDWLGTRFYTLKYVWDNKNWDSEI